MTDTPVTLVIAGGGERGRHTYGAWALAHPSRAKVVAVAEPDPERRSRLAAEHGIGAAGAFAGWAELLERERLADVLVIATPDRAHAAATIRALERGYHVILEKPIAPSAEEVRAVAEAADRSTGTVTVAHVLRYTPFFSTIRRLVDEGRIGELVTIGHAERIGHWHFAHSFVRGNWRREELSSPMILAKACHDLDLLRWLAGDRCTSVASFGGLHHFRPEQAPAGAIDRCWTPERRCPAADACAFDAHRFYVERLAGVMDWPVSVIGADETRAARLSAIATGPYGRCVYHADNDVADHQVTVLEFANGVHATLSVSGLTADNTRTIILGGTRGEIEGRLDTGRIELRRFGPPTSADSRGVESANDLTSSPRPDADRRPPRWDRDALGRASLLDEERVVLQAVPNEPDGHGGGDGAMMDELIDRFAALRDGHPGAEAEARTSLAASIESHLMAFAAEESRHQHRLVDLDGR